MFVLALIGLIYFLQSEESVICKLNQDICSHCLFFFLGNCEEIYLLVHLYALI